MQSYKDNMSICPSVLIAAIGSMGLDSPIGTVVSIVEFNINNGKKTQCLPHLWSKINKSNLSQYHNNVYNGARKLPEKIDDSTVRIGKHILSNNKTNELHASNYFISSEPDHWSGRKVDQNSFIGLVFKPVLKILSIVQKQFWLLFWTRLHVLPNFIWMTCFATIPDYLSEWHK